MSKDNHFRIYNKADQVIEVPANETSHSNVLDFMVGKVAGLDINAGDVRIRGTSSFGDNSTPLFLIDGVPLNTGKDMNLPDRNRAQQFRRIKTGVGMCWTW